jgi:uncharacterized damage-inducible protein DinB
MLTGATIRQWYLTQLRKALQTVNSLLTDTSVEAATTYRDGGQGWTVLEVLCHLRDYDDVFLQRARAAVELDCPDITGPNAEALARENRYNDQPLRPAYDEWVRRRERLLSYFDSLDEAQWARPANHPRLALMSVQDQLAFIAYHDVNHLEQMTRILAEKRA